MNDRRVVITGLGAISPLGMTLADLWDALYNGSCGAAAITAFDPAGFSCKIAGETPEFKIQKYVPKYHRKAIKLMSRDIKLSIVAANEAIENSGLVTKAIDETNINIDPARTAINIGAGHISCDLVELSPPVAKSLTDGHFDIRKWGSDGLNDLTPLWLLKYLPNMLACHIGIIHDFQGPSNSITCGEAGGQIAIGEAAQVIARGSADVALAGGCEAKVAPILILRQCLLKRAATENNDSPETACRPFDAGASGSVFGEGAGMIVLEDFDRAAARGVNVYAEIAGIGGSSNINPTYERLEANGKGIEIAIEMALTDAGICADDLDLIVPHGLGVLDDDRAEATALKNALGEAVKKIPVWPTKSMLTNTGAASGALDVVIAAMAIRNGEIGGAKNHDVPAEGCDLNITNQTQKKMIRYALCCSYTHGGQTAAIVLKNINGEK